MRIVDGSRFSGRDAVGWLSIYICLLFFVPSKLVLGPLGSAGAPSMLFGLISLVLWVLFRVGLWHEFETGVQPIKLAVGAFLVCVGVTYVAAMSRPIDVDEVSPADVALLATASWTGTMLVAHDGISTRERLETLIWRLVVCGGVIGFLGVVQVLTGQVWVDRISIPGLTLREVAGTFTRGAFLRPAGTAVHPIEYGVLVTMLLPLALHVGTYHQYRSVLLRWAPAAALGAVIPLTSSRSAYLGAAIGLCIYLVGWPARQRLVAAGMAAAGVVVMAVITPNLFDSIVSLFSGASEDPSIESRTGSYEVAGRFIDANPWFGRGLGTFLPKYRIFDNQYLGLLVSIGIVGTAMFVTVGLVAIVCLLRLRRTTGDAATRDLGVAVLAGIAVAFVGLVMFDAFSFPMTMGSIFLLLGIAGAMCRQNGPLSPFSRPQGVNGVERARRG